MILFGILNTTEKKQDEQIHKTGDMNVNIRND